MLISMTERQTNEERSRRTRSALVVTARRLFEANGYAGTSIEEVVRHAGVTRGALYHHFPTKQSLFDAVIVDIQDGLAARVQEAAATDGDPWDRFVAAWLSFIAAAHEAGVRRLMLEAPTVLGHRRWHEIDDGHYLPQIVEALVTLHDLGRLDVEPTPELARTLLAVSNALGTLVAQDDDPVRAQAHVLPVWERFLRSLSR
jgi:AcrR family transcriptional regulator